MLGERVREGERERERKGGREKGRERHDGRRINVCISNLSFSIHSRCRFVFLSSLRHIYLIM